MNREIIEELVNEKKLELNKEYEKDYRYDYFKEYLENNELKRIEDFKQEWNEIISIYNFVAKEANENE